MKVHVLAGEYGWLSKNFSEFKIALYLSVTCLMLSNDPLKVGARSPRSLITPDLKTHCKFFFNTNSLRELEWKPFYIYISISSDISYKQDPLRGPPDPAKLSASYQPNHRI